jgi:hypothetical protein
MDLRMHFNFMNKGNVSPFHYLVGVGHFAQNFFVPAGSGSCGGG